MWQILKFTDRELSALRALMFQNQEKQYVNAFENCSISHENGPIYLFNQIMFHLSDANETTRDDVLQNLLTILCNVSSRITCKGYVATTPKCLTCIINYIYNHNKIYNTCNTT